MNHCREAAHFFVCIYIILLGVATVYLSVGFPCNPWADVSWIPDKSRADSELRTEPNGIGRIVPSVKLGGCWRDCEAYAIRLYLALNPGYPQNNSRIALVQHLLAPIQPNPFCFSPPLRSLLQMDQNPFCSSESQNTPSNIDLQLMTNKDFKLKVRESARVHLMVVSSLCLDCIVVSLGIILIYISTLESGQPYTVSYALTVLSHVGSLFLSSYASRWLSCSPVDTRQRFCDGTQSTYDAESEPHLPDKASGVSNYEISLIIKNINLVCIAMAGLFEFSLRRSFAGAVVAPVPVAPRDPPHPADDGDGRLLILAARAAAAAGGNRRLGLEDVDDDSSEDNSPADL